MLQNILSLLGLVNPISLDYNAIVEMIFSFSISFFVTYFILSKFKFSNSFVVRFIQKTVIFSLSTLLILIIFVYVKVTDTIELSDQSIPLSTLIDGIFIYNLLELIIILILLYIINIKYIKTIVVNNISANRQYLNIIKIFVVLLLINKLINIFISFELTNNLDDYISIYNLIKKNKAL